MCKCASYETNKQNNNNNNNNNKKQEIRKALDNDEFTSGAILDFQKQGIIQKKYGRIGKTKNRKQKQMCQRHISPWGVL